MAFQPRPLKFPSVLPMHGDLVLKLLFDARQGSKLYDSSGYDNHGTITGANWVAGDRTGGLNFDASGEHVLITKSKELTTPNEFTWLAKIKLLKVSWGGGEEWATILAKDAFTRELWFTIFADRTIHVRFDSGNYQGSSTGTITYGVVQDVAVTWDGTNVRFYINKALDTTDPYSGTITETDYNLRIGNVTGDAYHFVGVIYKILMLKKALTATQIKRWSEHELLPLVI